MNTILKRILIAVLALTMILSMLVSCDETEKETETGTEGGTEAESGEELVDFDYANADVTKYITFSESEYLNSKVTLSTSYIITDETVDKYIKDERFDNKTKTNGDTQVKDQPIKLGDSAFIYYTGYHDGKAFEGGSNYDPDKTDNKPHELSIGSGSFIPGFEEGLIGIVPNTTSKDNPYDLHISFPKDYHSADLAGKAVVFKVWIEYVVQYTISELTDDYVKNTVKYDGTVDEYKAYVKSTLQTESDGEAQTEAISAIVSNLMEKAVVSEYPEQSVKYWYQGYVDQIQQYVDMYKMYGMNYTLDQMACQMLGLKEGEDWKTPLTDMAKRTVKGILIYYLISDQQNITVSDEEILAEAKKLAEQNSTAEKTYTAEEVIELVGKDAIKQNLTMMKVDEFLIDHCTIEYKDQ